MGLFPYITPSEHRHLHRCIQHHKDFTKLFGYKDTGNQWYYIDRKGVIHRNREGFYKATGWYPNIIKDGICYGWAEIDDMHNYIDPSNDEQEFLEKRGYERLISVNGDYVNGIKEDANYFKIHGRLPRWEKDGEKFETYEALVKEGYKYTGVPDFPLEY